MQLGIQYVFVITIIKANRICVLIFRDSTEGRGGVWGVVETISCSLYRIRLQEE